MGRFARNRNKHKKYRGKAWSDASSSSEQTQGATGGESDIPGYYYDEEKKTYFKILPNTMSSAGSFVTKENIKKDQDENRRLSDRNKETGESQKSCTGSSSSTPSVNVNKKAVSSTRHSQAQTLLDVLSSMQCGRYTCQSLERFVMRGRCQKMKPQPGWEDGRYPRLSSGRVSLEDIQKLELNTTCDEAVAVWSDNNGILQWMQLVSFQPAKHKQTPSTIGSHLNLEVGETSGRMGVSTNKVTSLCWCPLTQQPDKQCVLYTTMCAMGYTGNQVSIFDLGSASPMEGYLFSFDLGRNYVWSCAWNQHRSRFSVGYDRRCHVIDIHTRSKWTYNTHNSDALAQIFSHTNPHTLYAGTRNGHVLTIDLRAARSNQQTAAKFYQKHAVVCLRSCKDENYLMASDFSGLIRTWDVRFQKTVKTYTGLVNSHYQIPFYLDHTEQFVYATGSDGYCKVWDTSDCHLLTSLAPPLPSASPHTLPISHLSDCWGGVKGHLGLVTAMRNRFFVYS